MKRFISRVCAAAIGLSMLAAPVYADSEKQPEQSRVNEKTVVTNDGTNPNTGAVTLAGMSVVLAGAAVVISKKKK